MCFGCGAHGDVIDFTMRVHGIDLNAALDLLDKGSIANCRDARRFKVSSDRSVEAARIWSAAIPAAGTLAETYLRSRGLKLPIAPSIRFGPLPLGSRTVPALIAAVSRLDGEVLGVQRTFLRPDGRGKADVGKPKLSLGRVRGGAIRLTAPGPELIVTEGLEDGLTLQQALGIPVWVAAGAGMMPAMSLPVVVRDVLVGADADEAGALAAQSAAEAFSLSGRNVRIIRPLPPHKDFNAELMAEEGSRHER